MSSIDERIVSMKFNNGQFLNGIKGTLDALSGLKKGLNLDASKKGLDELAQTGRNFSMPGLHSAVEGVSGKFIAMATIGITALTNITNSAIAAGKQIVSSLTVDPIREGLAEYELQLNSIQTILANTQSKGSTLTDVNAALAELNTYADKTIYNFAEMSRNIGTFTAAGVDLETSTQAIKGIANLAAVSGSNSQQASTAMYQLSQALSTGTVKLMDWNSVVNAGMGGQVFQDALKETARAHGVGVDAIIEKQGSFRESLSEGWLTAEILTDTLAGFTGDLNAEQLKAMGYNEAQIEGILKMGQTAQDAATKVKTMTQLLDTMKEAAGSGWAQTWQLIFGDFEQARTMWTNVNNVLSGMIDASADARNAVVGEWNNLGGRELAIETIAHAFRTVLEVIKPVKEAFREIFPPITGQQLYDLTVKIRDFVTSLQVSEGMAANIKSTFKGAFAVLDIGRMIIMGLVGVIGDLFGVATEGAGGILDFTGNLGDFLVRVRDAIKNGEGLTQFFSGLSTVLTTPIKLIREFISWIRELFDGGIKSEGAEEAFDRLRTRIKPLLAMGEALAGIWKRMGKVVSKVAEFFAPLATALSQFFSGIGQAISESVSNMDYAQVLDSISVGLLGGIVLLLRNFLKGGINVDMGGGLVDSVKEMFGGVTETLGAMQAQLKAGTLLKIAGAIAVLAASVTILSLIDPAKLATALGAITVMFLQLGGAMALLEKITTGAGFAKLPFIAASLILLSTAILILSAAVKNLSGLSWEELAKGLAGTAALLLAVAGAVKIMSGASGALVRASAGLILIGVALRILIGSVKEFAGMDWAYMAKGMAGVAAALLALGLFTRLMAVNKGALASSVGLVILAGALKIIVSVVKDFAGMEWADLGKGFAAMGAALLIIAGAVALLPASLPVTATGLVILAGALVIVAQALGMMSEMTWEEIGKGMTVLAGSLLILAGALYLMSGALPGAAALIIAAGALAILTPVLLAMSAMSWDEILRGLTMLAGTFVVLGLAGLALTPVVPTLLLLGAAITLIGVGVIAAGLGVLALSAGLTALGAAAAVGAAAIVAVGAAIIGLIPAAMIALAQGIVGMIGVFVNAAPQFLVAATTLFKTLLDAVNNVAPDIINTVTKLIIMLLAAIETMVPEFLDTAVVVISTFLEAIAIIGPQIIDTLVTLILAAVDAIVTLVPNFVTAGMDIIIGVLDGIAQKVDDVIAAATDIIISFLQGIQDNYPLIIDEAAQTVVTFVQGLADGINNNMAALQAAGRDLAFAIADGLTGGLASRVQSAASAAANWAGNALQGAKDALGIASPSKEFEKLGKFANEGYIKGLKGNQHDVVRVYNEMLGQTKFWAEKTAEDLRVATARLKEFQREQAKAADKDKKKFDKDIQKQKDIIKQAQAEIKAAKASYELVKSHRDEADELKKLANSYEATTNKLKDAQAALDEARRVRDSYRESITSQYSDLADIDKETNLSEYLDNLRKQIGDTKIFAQRMAKLRGMGLNDVMYEELMGRGLDALPFVDQLLEGGASAVKEVNNLSTQLGTTAQQLGKAASDSMYKAGVDAAEGIVKGLQSKQSALRKEMDTLADAMVAALKRRLAIKSPSRVFAALGEDTANGLVVGLDKTKGVVRQATAEVADTAMEALRKGMANVGRVISTDMDMTPTIRPVLDLSEIRRGSGLIDGMLTPSHISPDASYGKAATIAIDDRELRQALEEITLRESENAQPTVQLTQINNSPKALSSADIYRQTRNQLSVVKGALPR